MGPDKFVVFTCCVIEFNGIVGGGNVFGKNEKGQGIGLHLDSSEGSIVHNKIFVNEINACATGIFLGSGGRGIVNNSIECPFDHICNTLIEVRSGSYNRITAMLDPGGVGGVVTGANLLGGKQNIYNLMWVGNFAAGKALVFGTEARDNVVHAVNLPLDGVTNQARTATNLVIPSKPVGFGITTPKVPASGEVLVNRQPYSVVIMILTPGLVSNWSVIDANGKSQSISGKLYAGQSIYLEPGDAISIGYTEPPSWSWRALR